MRQVRTGVTEAAQALIAMMNRWGRIDRQGPGERERERENKPSSWQYPSLNERLQALPKKETDEHGRNRRWASDPGHPGPGSTASPQDRTPPNPPKTGGPAPEDERQAASVPCRWKTPHPGQEVDGWGGWENE